VYHVQETGGLNSKKDTKGQGNSQFDRFRNETPGTLERRQHRWGNQMTDSVTEIGAIMSRSVGDVLAASCRKEKSHGQLGGARGRGWGGNPKECWYKLL